MIIKIMSENIHVFLCESSLYIIHEIGNSGNGMTFIEIQQKFESSKNFEQCPSTKNIM